MTMTNIAEKSFFVIILAVFCFFSLNCGASSGESDAAGANSPETGFFDKPVITGALESRDLNESSGLAASKCQPGVFWTHNDSGGGPFIFAINQSGRHLGVWRVPNAVNVDWEDIAAYKNTEGKCFLYIGDIGDNARRRKALSVYRISEPKAVGMENTSPDQAPATEPAGIIRFRYPDGAHDSEALMVHPVTGVIYLITKRLDGPAEIYKIPSRFVAEDVLVAKKVGEISLPAVPNGLVTGGDISSDGRRVVLCDYLAGYLFVFKTGDFDSIWYETPSRFDLGAREIGEAVAFNQLGTGVLAASEGVGSPLVFVRLLK